MNSIWYHIPGFNGYLINEDGDVRSMKMMYADPGHPLKRYGKQNPYYILSNDNNEKTKVTVKELLEIVFHSDKSDYATPVYENDVYLGGRNKIINKSPKPKKETECRLTICDNVEPEEFVPIRFL